MRDAAVAGNGAAASIQARAAPRAARATPRSELLAEEMSLLGEVEDLGRAIANAKSEIAALRVDDVTIGQIPLATDELDAIIAHTAAATERILETCETLDQVATELDGPAAAERASASAARLREATTRIYEACGFQDITGQRITKIVAALKVIEAKVARIVATFGERGRPPGRAVAAVAAPADVADPASLLNGPQLPASAMDQTDIDKLLAALE
jgi:chemotaxis protein CheZ